MENNLMTAKDGIQKIYVQAMQKELDPQAAPVVARVNIGRWIADCECNGAELVEPDNPKFFCFSCGNSAHGGKARPVIIPGKEERAQIASRLMELPEAQRQWRPEALESKTEEGK